MPKYSIAVTTQAVASEAQNPHPSLISKGMIRNMGIDGRTSQKTPRDTSATRLASELSTYSQTKASTDVNGSDARTDAQNVLRLAISDTATTTAEVSSTFTSTCHICAIDRYRPRSAAAGRHILD